MDPAQKSEIISACRQYADAKFKLRRLFPSLHTSAEIDDLATLVIDMASSALSSALAGESKKIKKSLHLADKVLTHGRKIALTDQAPAGVQEPFVFRDRMKAVMEDGDNKPMTARQIGDEIVRRGWKAGSGKYPIRKLISNTLIKDTDHFTRRGVGLYCIRRHAEKAA